MREITFGEIRVGAQVRSVWVRKGLTVTREGTVTNVSGANAWADEHFLASAFGDEVLYEIAPPATPPTESRSLIRVTKSTNDELVGAILQRDREGDWSGTLANGEYAEAWDHQIKAWDELQLVEAGISGETA